MRLFFAMFFCVIAAHVTPSVAGGPQPPLPVDEPDDKLVPFAALPPDIAASGTMTACLNRRGGAMSGWRQTGGAGLDYGVLAALAETLGLRLGITWFEPDRNAAADPVTDAYAMLSLGLCDVVAAHPVKKGATGAPKRERATVPRWKDMPDSWHPHREVTLRPIAATIAYRRVELGIVTSGALADMRFKTLSDLMGNRVGVQTGTLSETILRDQGPPHIMGNAVLLPAGPKFLWDMEIGLFDATLIDVGAYDFHRRQNHISKLKLADYRHPSGVDISLAVLADRAGLREVLDTVLSDMTEAGTVDALSVAEGVTYIAPHGSPPTGTE